MQGSPSAPSRSTNVPSVRRRRWSMPAGPSRGQMAPSGRKAANLVRLAPPRPKTQMGSQRADNLGAERVKTPTDRRGWSRQQVRVAVLSLVLGAVILAAQAGYAAVVGWSDLPGD